MHWSLNHDAYRRPTNPTRGPHKREIELCDRCSTTTAAHSREIEMQFCPNVCQKCRMNEWTWSVNVTNAWLTEWMNEWISCAAQPAGAFTRTNTAKSAAAKNDAWVAALSAFSVRGFPSKSKNEKREIQICTTIKEKLVLQLYATRKYPEYYWNNC